jgi:subtilisin family serine protease
VNRPSARRLSQLAAVGAVSLVAACSSDTSLTSPDDGAALMSAADAMAAVQAGPPQFVAGEVLVKFRDGATTASRGRALGRAGGQVAEEILTGAMRAQGRRVGVSRVRVAGDVQRAIAALQADPDVEYAEPNWVYQHQATSNDTYYTNGSLWGMYGSATSPSNQYGTGAAAAWAANKVGSSSVYIGIIDEGYMYTHEDLAANAGTNPGETAGNGRDDDGNGLVDDVYGWDFDGNNSSVFDGTGDDHGTHVAGTIGGVGGNGKGVAGVVWNVKLLSAKFLGSRGGTTANAIKAVDYFTTLKQKGVNIVATNNSWGGGGFSQALKDAIDRANAANILFVAAAGNSGTNNDATASYPSGYTSANIIAVASITSTGALSSFSQYGATTVDIGAPGSGIWSTVPKSSKGKVISGYASYNGTSMATPHVSGAVALYASLNPGASAAQIKAAIMNSATPTPSLAGKTVTGGRLNVSGF